MLITTDNDNFIHHNYTQLFARIGILLYNINIFRVSIYLEKIISKAWNIIFKTTILKEFVPPNNWSNNFNHLRQNIYSSKQYCLVLYKAKHHNISSKLEPNFDRNFCNQSKLQLNFASRDIIDGNTL